MGYFVEFFKSLFDIGNSAGSLISEAVTLFKTFQKLSAPKVFSTKFSKECTDMFRWASKIINYISDAIQTVPLSEYELFCIYTFIFPVSIIIFISCSIVKFLFLIILTLFGGFFAIGLGISDYFIDEEVYFMPTIMGAMYSLVMIIIIIVLLCCKCFFDDNDTEKAEKSKGSSALLAFIASATVFYILMLPIMLQRWKLAKIISIIISIFVFICIMVYFSSLCCHFQHKLVKIQQKVNGFLITCLPLFIIPSTETFSDLIAGSYKGSYAIIVSYIYNSVVVPLALIIAMVILRHPNITEKYNANCCGSSFFYFFELFDYMKQIGYAFAAIYDVLWACLLIEIAWIVLVFACRPYKSISEYSLSAGNSLIIIITNSAIIYSNNHHTKQFSFAVSIFFLILACIPAIVALYLYFIFDFNYGDADLSISSDFSFSNEHSPGIKLGMVVVFMAPLSWFCYGLNFSFINKTANISYI